MTATFYQKYRSRTFQEIVGQEHVVQTLKNAIENNRLSHAYIFSGPRGTGKTSLARILAKSLNCRTQGPSATPCLECDLCKGITSGTSPDVIEIDAASNTGVDNIRDLNEKMGFMPLECRYKIYIIDEAHMLSTGAFNALLKTLEEPPSSTVFILATTEPHKIPVTIHSRCQQLHFRNLTLNEIQAHVQEVCQSESIQIDQKAVQIIARNAGGCMRDALSLLNHVFSFKGNTIVSGDVLFVLGSTDDSRLLTLLQSIAISDHPAVLQALDALYADGANPGQLLSDLLRILRSLLRVAAGVNDDGFIDDQTQLFLKQIAKDLPLPRLTRLIETLAKTESELRWFSSAELLLQLRLLTWETEKQAPQPAAQTSQPVKPAVAAASNPTQPQFVAKPSSPAATQTPAYTQSIPNTAAPAAQSNERRVFAPQKPVETVSNPQPTAKEEQPKATPQPTGAFGTKNWMDVLSEIKAQKSALHSVLKDSYLVESSNTSITIALKQDFQFFREKIKEEKNRQWLSGIIQKVYGQSLQVHLKETGGSQTQEGQTFGTVQEDKPATASGDAQREERINRIVALFEGTIV